MRRPILLGLLATAVVGLVAISNNTRPALKAQQAPALISANSVGGAFGGGDPKEEPGPPIKIASKPMTVAETKVRLKLQEKIAFDFPPGTPLQDVVKFIQTSTSIRRIFLTGSPSMPILRVFKMRTRRSLRPSR